MSFSSSSILDPSYGAHPTIVTTVSLPELTSNSTCSLLLQYTLPPLLFVDKYELEMRSQEYQVVDLRGRGARELEKPAHALPITEELDDNIGVELVVKKDIQFRSKDGNHGIQVHLPIHVRYGKPVASKESSPYAIQVFEPPNVGLACRGGLYSCDQEAKAPEYLLSFVAAFDTHCLASTSSAEALKISVPLGNTLDLPFVELGTSAVIIVCFAWIALEAWRAVCKLRTAHGKEKTD